jgi:hypothetical protein
MDYTKIIADLTTERDRLNVTIDVLQRLAVHPSFEVVGNVKPKKRGRGRPPKQKPIEKKQRAQTLAQFIDEKDR